MRLTIALVAALLTCCHRHHDWDRTREFEARLRCGMSVEEVHRLATALGATTFARPQLAGHPDVPDYYVSEKERLISLWFKGDRLTAYMSAITSMEHDEEGRSDRVELCGGTSGPVRSALPR
jgi:hypothetical protein